MRLYYQFENEFHFHFNCNQEGGARHVAARHLSDPAAGGGVRAVRLPTGRMPHCRGSLPGAFQGRFGREQNHGVPCLHGCVRQAGLRRYAPHESGKPPATSTAPGTESHLHIRCRTLRGAGAPHCDEVEAFAAHLGQHHGFTLDESQTILYGLCQACQEKNAK